MSKLLSGDTQAHASPQALPEAFVWSKMGTEGGEGLAAILKRKEFERVLGNGLFVWGIGNALGDAVHALAAVDPTPFAVFSPMASKPKRHDVAPEQVVLWGAYEGSAGEAIPLPLHAIVTSRGRLEELSTLRHYALFCHSTDPIGAADHQYQEVVPALHRNFASGRALGSSQVTAVVRRASVALEGGERSYPVSFLAKLVGPRYARLLCPRPASPDDIATIAAGLSSIQSWKSVVTNLATLRSRAVASYRLTV